MRSPFQEADFLKLLIGLMTEAGPSLNEGPRRRFIQKHLEESGLSHREDVAGNILVDFGATATARTVVFDAHIDVVEKGFCERPQVDAERVAGLGSGDNLTAVTMLLLLARELKTVHLSRPLQLVFSVGEEGKGNLNGMRRIVKDRSVPPHLFVSFDLSYDKYTITGVGSNRYQVDLKCEGGHSWNDFGSPNAIELLTDYLGRIKFEFRELAALSTERLSYNIGSIGGGTGINSIARNASAQFEFRSLVPELLREMDSQVQTAAKAFDVVDGGTFHLNYIGKRPAAEATDRERIEALVRSVWEGEGLTPVAVPRSTNINMTLASGWPSVCLGLCLSHRNHREDEYVIRHSLSVGWRLLQELTHRLVLCAA